MRRRAMKKRCLQHRALIVSWLRVNYCLRESGSIAKRDVFLHYLELCKANKIKASSAASFGKILKLAFPTVRCNRVGPRGASKHHYRGLTLRDQYSTSLDGVKPVSEDDIRELMKNMSETGDEDEEDADDDSGDGGLHIKAEQSSPPESSSSPQRPSSPAGPADPAADQSLPYRTPPSSEGTFEAPVIFSPYLSAAHPPLFPHHIPKSYPMLPLPQHYLTSYPPTGAMAGKKESFSWISPDMDSSGKRIASYPVLPPPLPQQQLPTFLSQDPTSSMMASAARKQWQEKQDLVEFCERNFQCLYESLLRTNCGEAKGDVLACVGEAWKNLRSYTRQLNLYHEPPAAMPSATSDNLDQAPVRRGTTMSPERTSSGLQKGAYQPSGPSTGGFRADIDKCGVSSQPPPIEQPSASAPLPGYTTYHQQIQRAQLQFTPTKRSSRSSSPHSSGSGPAAQPQSAGSPSQHLPQPIVGYAGGSQPLSFTGSSSSLSLSWLNSMAYSMGAAGRAAALPSPTPLSGSSTGSFPASYSLTELGGNRGSLEGLEYRSFEWKGVFE